MSAPVPDPAGGAPSDAEHLAMVREETRTELGLLHERVNALLAAEAFLTIAYTAAMSNGADWGRTFAVVAAPVLAVLGLLLALLALPGVATTARIILAGTALQDDLYARLPATGDVRRGVAMRPAGVRDQRRGLVFFRAVPVLFAVVWVVLLALALALLS